MSWEQLPIISLLSVDITLLVALIFPLFQQNSLASHDNTKLVKVVASSMMHSYLE